LRDGAQFDLAVLDIKTGGSPQGSMTVAALLDERGTPFVFLTGMRADNAQARKFPRAPVVEKPYQVEVLMEALRRLLTG
jgi:CheY-like chemotaxis protein